MIIYHQTNVAGFAGNHVWYWPTRPFNVLQYISGTSEESITLDKWEPELPEQFPLNISVVSY